MQIVSANGCPLFRKTVVYIAGKRLHDFSVNGVVVFMEKVHIPIYEIIKNISENKSFLPASLVFE